MVSIRKRTVGNSEYFYLEHTTRSGRKIEKKELYLGKEIPKNIEEIKKNFMKEIYIKKWYVLLNEIKSNFSREQQKMPSSAKEKELAAFATKFTYDTQRIEGSTLTLKETANLLDDGITPKNKPIRDIKEAEAHKKLFYIMLDYKKDLSLNETLYWNKVLLQETKPDVAGKIRTYQVTIARSRFNPPLPAELNMLLKEFFDWYSSNKNKINPVELAALVHLKFVTIHPFSDGNGRISRIMMNFVLHKNNYPMLDIPYTDRNGYYNALERSQIKKQDSIFVQWFIKHYLKIYRNYLKSA